MKCPHCKKEFNSKYEIEELAEEILLLFGVETNRGKDSYRESAMKGAEWILKNFTRKNNTEPI